MECPRVEDRSAAPGRLASLDLLRALAVILVLGRHVEFPLIGWHPAAASFLRVWATGGWVGVDLFFVLSGFLVSSLLFREHLSLGRVSVGRFLVRRGLKIYPAFYAFLALTTALAFARWGVRSIPPRALASEALFVQNYGPAVWWHTWSLAVEEHFYLLCALLFLVLSRGGRGRPDPFRPVPWVFLALAASCLGARVATGLRLPYTHETHLFPTHLRIDSLMFGVLLAYLWHLRPGALRGLLTLGPPGLGAAGGLLLAWAFVVPLETSLFAHTLGLTVLYLGSGLLVLAALGHPEPRGPVVRAAARLGACSYSIYLWHLFVKFTVEEWVPRLWGLSPRSPLAVAAYLAGSLALGVLAAWAVEMPVLRLRDRLFPSALRPRGAAPGG